jgi:hypothetical protein
VSVRPKNRHVEAHGCDVPIIRNILLPPRSDFLQASGAVRSRYITTAIEARLHKSFLVSKSRLEAGGSAEIVDGIAPIGSERRKRSIFLMAHLVSTCRLHLIDHILEQRIMPGAYAHITLVNLAKEPHRLEAGPGMAGVAISALMDWFKYCELGAVSPDYPYLAPPLTNQARWADLMHYERTGDMIKVGIPAVRKLAGEEKRRGIRLAAWLHCARDRGCHHPSRGRAESRPRTPKTRRPIESAR